MNDAAPLLYFEDFAEGATAELGSYAVSREEIVAFAREFDPQPFHVDEEAAARSPLGGLAASGWHVCAMLMRMMVDGYLHRTAGLGSPGIDELKWLKPVFPGETLSASYRVLSRRVSSKRPEMGIVSMQWSIRNQAGELKCEMTGINLIRVRSP